MKRPLEPLERRLLLAAELVKDLNSSGMGSWINDIAGSTAATFFVEGGTELWKTDGTAKGTSMLRTFPNSADMYSSGGIIEMLGVGKTLYFTVDDDTGDKWGPGHRTLWKSDGTVAGTVILADVGNPDGEGVSNLTRVGGSVYFQADSQLWISNGTGKGTKRVTELQSIEKLTDVNGRLYFSAYESASGAELWTTDGTAAGTKLVKNIASGAASASPGNLTNVNGTLFFSATDPTHGHELWKTDGTAAGTVLVKDIVSGSGSGMRDQLPGVVSRNAVAVGNLLIFAANLGTANAGVWKSDGTASGTILLKKISGGWPEEDPEYHLTAAGNRGYFLGKDSTHGVELWTTDGTVAGTTMLKDIASGAADAIGYGFAATELNGDLFFTADDGTHGVELWRTNGTSQGTSMLADLYPGPGGFNTGSGGSIANINGTLYFTGNDRVHGSELWRSDGTAAGTAMVHDLTPGSAGSSARIWVSGDHLFAAGTDGLNYVLWQSDGTNAGTVRILSDDAEYISAYAVGELTLATTAYGSMKLWKSSGGEATLIREFTGGMNFETNMVSLGKTVYFPADDGVHGRELWKTDGTVAGTKMVKDIRPGSGESWGHQMLVIGNTIYFSADDGTHGSELWKSDGTSAGTVMVKDIYPGSTGSSIRELVNVSGTLCMIAYDSHGTGIWKSNGTSAGTTILRQDSTDGYLSDLVNVNGTLYFSVDSALWKSTGNGNTLVKAGVTVNGAAAAGGILYFAGDSGNGNGLWKSDGTEAGTGMVKDIRPGGWALEYGVFASLGDTVYFAADDGVHGTELWKSDGTPVGTAIVQDLRAGANGSMMSTYNNTAMATLNGSLYFVADDGETGSELWVVDPPVGQVNDGVLVISGSARNDTIGMTVKDQQLRVRRNGVVKSFDLSAISRVEISSGDGDDIIDFSGISIPTYVDAGAGNDLVTGGAGNDSLTGGAGKDSLYGGEGDDRINGYGTNDKLFGQGGNDRIYGGAHNDYIDGGGGVDRIWGEDGNDTLCGSSSNDKINGGLGDDSILGGKGNDLLTCGGGADTLFGNDGDDTFSAVDGAKDLLDGGLGADSAMGDSQDLLSGIES